MRATLQQLHPLHSQADKMWHVWTVGIGSGRGCLVRTCGRVVWPAATWLGRESGQLGQSKRTIRDHKCTEQCTNIIDTHTEITQQTLPAVISSKVEGIKKSATLESASLGVVVPAVISGGPALPKAACHSEENSVPDAVAGVFRMSFSSVASSLSMSKSADSKSTPPRWHASKHYRPVNSLNLLFTGKSTTVQCNDFTVASSRSILASAKYWLCLQLLNDRRPWMGGIQPY